MSRTDVHRPWRVQIADPHNRHILRVYGDWNGEPLVTSHRNIGCGCHLCTGQPWRKFDNRRERTTWRTQRQAALKVRPADRDIIDAPAFRCRSW